MNIKWDSYLLLAVAFILAPLAAFSCVNIVNGQEF